MTKGLSINATYYIKNINNLIIQRRYPTYDGGGMQYINVGAIGVNGKELNIEANPVKTKDFSWYVNLIFLLRTKL